MSSFRIFCLPHAGGAASTFLSWKRLAGADIDIVPIELPGRGRRFSEPFAQTVADAVADTFEHIRPCLEELPYAIFGHSMGTILAYELARKIDNEGIRQPRHMFFSGRNAPYDHHTGPDLSSLSDKEFISTFASLGGISREMLENNDALSYMLPILRADTRLVNSYVHNMPIHVFPCDITVMSGLKDLLTPQERMLGWKNCCKGNCTFLSYDDAHFFINGCRANVVSDIARTINKYSHS